MSQLTSRVPVGFRFHPTDEELVGYYLPKKINARKIDLDLIRELDLYKLEPWDLQELCEIQASSASEAQMVGERPSDCYFFSRKDKKYPTGNRANRATAKGFWKATGRDKPISAKLQTRLIGMRKTLVFYQGRAPHGLKTDWIMHEFRLDDGPGRPAHEDGGWVVCRVFRKNKNLRTKQQERAVSYEEQLGLLPEPHDSPEYLSTSRFVFTDHHQLQYMSTPPIKQELLHLDDLHYGSHNSHITSPAAAAYHSMLPSYMNFHNFPESESPNTTFHGNEATTSGSDGGDGEDDAVLGLESVDWSALLQEPPNSKTGSMMNTGANVANEVYSRIPSGKMMMNVGSDMAQLKRQNSDIFSALELWNYNPVAQQL